MSKRKVRENRVEKILGICFLMVGLVMFLVGLAITAGTAMMQKNRDMVKGILLEVTGESRTLVEYTYEGRTYEEWLSEYSSSMHTGDEIALYVDRENPKKVRTAELLYLPVFILCIIGIPFFLIGFFFLFSYTKKNKKKQRLMQNGRRIYAEVTGGRINFNYSVNGRHPYILECQYTDEFTGAVYLFGSYNIWLDPNLYMGQQVLVYVDPADFGNYYVDVDSLQSTQEVYDYR